MPLFQPKTRNLFFTGKGGVGKTSMACATAIQLADAGERVLLVSTDPASNLDEVLETSLGQQPTPIVDVAGLWALNLDPEQAAEEYRERMVGPYRGVLPDVAIASMEEQYSGSCTVEIAAFDQFARLLGHPESTQDFDRVIFDTAPTGHTLRLLALPSAWTTYIEDNTTGTSCLGPLAGLQEQQLVYQQTVETLRNPDSTTLVLVTRPEPSALAEAARTYHELTNLNVNNQTLIVNGVFRTDRHDDPVATAMQQRCLQALDQMPSGLKQLSQTQVPLQADNLLGIAALRAIGGTGRTSGWKEEPIVTTPVARCSENSFHFDDTQSLKSLIDSLEQAPGGVILTMGKGGVGKTTLGAAVAVGLAERGHAVHLTTTDPAAHLQSSLGPDEYGTLQVSRIDPHAVTHAYREEVFASAGDQLDDRGRALLEEDLRSPCTEEVAVFRAFAEAVAMGQHQTVVLDTAPTGHTILLLDAALAYHREVDRQANQVPSFVQELLPRLRDPSFTRILVVTLPESTPVHEASVLQDDLRRAKIEPFAWIVNQCLTPLECRDPVLKARQENEQRWLRKVVELSPRQPVMIPWQAEPPIGLHRLRSLG